MHQRLTILVCTLTIQAPLGVCVCVIAARHCSSVARVWPNPGYPSLDRETFPDPRAPWWRKQSRKNYSPAWPRKAVKCIIYNSWITESFEVGIKTGKYEDCLRLMTLLYLTLRRLKCFFLLVWDSGSNLVVFYLVFDEQTEDSGEQVGHLDLQAEQKPAEICEVISLRTSEPLWNCTKNPVLKTCTCPSAVFMWANIWVPAVFL